MLWEILALFVLGGSGYVGLELAWRGASHWTMFVAGGAALCWLSWLAQTGRVVHLPLLTLAGIGAAGITLLEYATGLLCTRLLHLQVWDYGREWGNLAGLICPKYTLLWFLLCLGVLAAMQGLQRWLRI